MGWAPQLPCHPQFLRGEGGRVDTPEESEVHSLLPNGVRQFPEGRAGERVGGIRPIGVGGQVARQRLEPDGQVPEMLQIERGRVELRTSRGDDPVVLGKDLAQRVEGLTRDAVRGNGPLDRSARARGPRSGQQHGTGERYPGTHSDAAHRARIQLRRTTAQGALGGRSWRTGWAVKTSRRMDVRILAWPV